MALAEIRKLDRTWEGLSKTQRSICRQRLERMVASHSLAGLHTRSQLVEYIYWVQLRLPKLFSKYLTTTLREADHEGGPLRDILASYTVSFSVDLRLRLRREIFRGVKDHRGTGTSAFNAASKVVWEMLYAHGRNAPVRSRVSSLEAREVLRESSAEVRNQTIAVLARWLTASKPEDRARLWRDQYGPAFKELWLLDHRYQNEETSKDLAELCVAAGAEFPNALEAVLPFLVPLEREQWPSFHHLTPETAGDLLSKFPREIVTLLWALLKPPTQGKCTDLPEIMDALKKTEPAIASDRRFQWLLDREARY